MKVGEEGKIDRNVLQGMFNDYWKKTEKNKYHYKVSEVYDKYKDLIPGLSPSKIAGILIRNGMKKNHGTCVYCKSVIYPKSRLDIHYKTVRCDCDFRGFCRKCKLPYKRDEEGYCFDCYICERQALEKKQKDISKLDDLEMRVLYLIKDFPNVSSEHGKYDEFAMAEVLWEDADRVRKSLNSLVDKGYIHKVIENCFMCLDIKLGGPTLDLPDRQIDYPCLTAAHHYFTSSLARELHQVLRDECPRVFPEQSPLAFLNKERCLEELDATEKEFFHNLRFSFVCAHENSIPFLAVQVNEQNNLADRFDRWKRQVWQKLCDLANIEFVEVRSREDILRLTKTKPRIRGNGCVETGNSEVMNDDD